MKLAKISVWACLGAVLWLAVGSLAVTADEADAPSVRIVHALSLTGLPKYGDGFTHTNYVNPNAPKGGHARLAVANGTFDSLNPFISQGTSAVGLTLVYEYLTESLFDDIVADYGLIAESMTVPDDHSWVEFHLRPEARWHDGKSISVDDVIFSFDVITKKAKPFYQFYYRNVASVEQTGPRSVKFIFDQAGNRELPQIMGQLPILPKHYWQDRDFSQPTLDIPLGSGPYRVAKVEPGRSITYERVKDYWGQSLPIKIGNNNFDQLTWEYYRDAKVAVEALKAGEFDFRSENSSQGWAKDYDFPGFTKGEFVKLELPHKRPAGMQGLVYNTRRDKFNDPRVRKALAYAFDFEWTNRTLFYGQYTRTQSYFQNSELASRGLPTEAELALLEPFRDQLPPEVFGPAYQAPVTDGSGNARGNLRKAVILLREAGWRVVDGVLTSPEGTPLTFEILLVSPLFERVVAPFIDNLKILGVQASIRIVDAAQYEQRLQAFDYDMIVNSIGQSLSPGNEQRDFFASSTANMPGSRNRAGVADPVVDALIDKIIFAPDRASLVAACRAMDRVLLNSHYLIPQYHVSIFRLAFWDRFGRPEVMADYNHGFPFTWWIDPAKDTALNRSREN